jgi:hypothetical protein
VVVSQRDARCTLPGQVNILADRGRPYQPQVPGRRRSMRSKHKILCYYTWVPVLEVRPAPLHSLTLSCKRTRYMFGTVFNEKHHRRSRIQPQTNPKPRTCLTHPPRQFAPVRAVSASHDANDVHLQTSTGKYIPVLVSTSVVPQRVKNHFIVPISRTSRYGSRPQ